MTTPGIACSHARGATGARGPTGGGIRNSPAAWSARALSVADAHEATRWSEAGQRERFDSVLAALDPKPGESLLDFGCGTGALSELLPEGVDYLGYDWAAGMVMRARCEHPGRSFSRLWPDGPFDLVACIGTFNLRDGWSKEQTWKTLASLRGRCRRAIAVCLYAGKDPDCLIYSEDEIPFIAHMGEARTTVTRHRPNDLLLLMERT